MSTPSYTYVLADLLTDRTMALLPLSGVSFERRIGRAGAFSATLEAADDRRMQLAKLVHSLPGRAAIYAIRNKRIWWGGVLWTSKASQGPRDSVALELQAATFESYPHRRVLREDVTYTQVDQGTILPDLWRRLQADPRGNIGVQALNQATGVLRDRTYLGSDLETYGKRIEELGDVENGPEHTIDVWADAEGVRHKALRLGARLGSVAPTAVFSRGNGGGKVLSWSNTADAVDGGTTFQTRGDSLDGNVGEDKGPLLSRVVESTRLLDQGWPLLDVVEDYTGVTVLETLDGYATQLEADLAGALRDKAYTVQVTGDGWSPNSLGDSVRLKLSDPWHRPVTDAVVRPVACKVTAPDRGTDEQVDLIFGEE